MNREFDSEYCNVKYIEEEMDMWTKEFSKYFTVKKETSYEEAIKVLKSKI